MKRGIVFLDMGRLLWMKNAGKRALPTVVVFVSSLLLPFAKADATTVTFENLNVAHGSSTTINGNVTSRGFLFDSARNHLHYVWDAYSGHNSKKWLDSDNSVLPHGRERRSK
jgi:hypothetical protein